MEKFEFDEWKQKCYACEYDESEYDYVWKWKALNLMNKKQNFYAFDE